MPETRYGSNMRQKLTPPLSMATISVFEAIREVKYTTAMNVNSALNIFTK
jgi:hypothetical protein